MNNELIEHLLAFDVIKDAEKTTKHPYNQDGLTQRLAALNFIKRGQKLAKELKANSDTYRSMLFLDLINTVMSEGFIPVYTESFQGNGYAEKPLTEALLVFYHEAKGILLTAESFGVTMVNRAVMYYNWVPNQLDKEWTRAVSSGSFVKGDLVWKGSHEVNEAFRYKLKLLHRKGYFCQWQEQPHLWLLNYPEGRTKTGLEEVKVINQKKMSQLPEFVRKAILA